ncbi:MAG: 2-oxo acid dehydrogenase subunit E2, partial [Candidatus Latescibacteria bacterium]|nr:2-oxo acid dehydrogenase subunit E2 [Candidatus Latescibacterota bacterium]
ASGFLRKILSNEGDTVSVSETIGYIADSMEEELPQGSDKTETPSPASGEIKKIKASPRAKKIAEERGIDLSRITGSSPGGRITRKDVEDFQSSDQTPSEVIPLSGMRKTMAERLSRSKREAPHFYLQTEVDMSDAVRMRQSLLEEIEKRHGVRLSYTDMIIKSVAQALTEFPMLNATFENGEIRLSGQVNVAVAVSVEEGLIVPVVREANGKTLRQITQEKTGLIARAKANQLALEDLSDGTFTLSNLGMFDVDGFIGIINPPQVGLLAVGRIKEMPRVIDRQVAIREVMNVSLSIDHRAVSGAYGAQFLSRAKELLEKPYLLLMDL